MLLATKEHLKVVMHAGSVMFHCWLGELWANKNDLVGSGVE